jgi:hypothetical protein
MITHCLIFFVKRLLSAYLDGCMLPIVTISEEEGDKRKHKNLHWQEAV